LALGCSVLGLIGCAVAENFFSYIAPLCRLPEFLFGIVVGLMLADPPRAGSRAALALAGARALAALAAVNPACRSGLWIRANFFRAGLRRLDFRPRPVRAALRHPLREHGNRALLHGSRRDVPTASFSPNGCP
jgi:hypothetical protein